jgi:SagB-type dehydrogenase family enzyme
MPASRRTRRARRYQTRPDLICYWQDSLLVLHEVSGGRRLAVTTLALGLLAFCRVPRTAPDVSKQFPGLSVKAARHALKELVGHGLIRTGGARPSQSSLQPWQPWAPAASFFHFATKDIPWASGQALQDFEDADARRALKGGAPAPVKRVRSRTRVGLARSRPKGEFVEALLARRTWRAFAESPVRLEALSQLLDLTFGVRHWATSEGGERVILRTSPSAGACHPIEAYLIARSVKRLPAGVYHYDADRHELALIRKGASALQVERFLSGQWWYRNAAAVVVMTAVLPRVWARYPYAQAYRSVLLDAGHICQTFCLTATWLDLAPFCTMALADTAIERHLKIDGVNEVVIYAAGIGNRPAGGHVQWPDRPPGKTYLAP